HKFHADAEVTQATESMLERARRARGEASSDCPGLKVGSIIGKPLLMFCKLTQRFRKRCAGMNAHCEVAGIIVLNAAEPSGSQQNIHSLGNTTDILFGKTARGRDDESLAVGQCQYRPNFGRRCGCDHRTRYNAVNRELLIA